MKRSTASLLRSGKAMLCLIAARIGRFAPPHWSTAFGSLLTAVASYCDAKANHGKWLVRIEDTDIPRIYPNSEAHILSCIDAFQFEPDAENHFPKDRLELYEQVLEQLNKSRRFMPVNAHVKCWVPIISMQVLVVTSVLISSQQAIRLKVADQLICFDDRLQGPTMLKLAT